MREGGRDCAFSAQSAAICDRSGYPVPSVGVWGGWLLLSGQRELRECGLEEENEHG